MAKSRWRAAVARVTGRSSSKDWKRTGSCRKRKSTGKFIMKTDAKPLTYKMNDVIRLNVGGQRFDTHLKTLLVDRSNEIFQHFVVLLENDLSEDKLPVRDIDGAFFLDRDPEHFRTLLNNLRYTVYAQQKARLGKSSESLNVEEDTKSTKSSGFLGRFRKGN